MALVQKSGYKRNIWTTNSGGLGGKSYAGYGGPYFETKAGSAGFGTVDQCYRTWWSDSDWKASRAANGFLPTRNMTLTRLTAKQVPVSNMDILQVSWGPIYCRLTQAQYAHIPYHNTLPPNGLSLTVDIEGVVGPAKNRCLNAARDMKVSLPIAFAEGRKTVQMIADTARRLAEAYKAFRRGNFRRVANLLGIPMPRGAANNWLAYQFGWLPLISDLKGLAELAAQQLELGGRKPRFKVYGRYETSGKSHTEIGQNMNIGSLGGYTEATFFIDKPRFIGKAWLLCEVQYSDAALASQAGFGGFSDLASVAWELVPFSFVFDWFVGVGETLSAMSALSGLTVLDGGSSLEQTFTLKQWTSRPGWYPGYVFLAKTPGPSWSGKKMHYQRSTWNGGVSPFPRFRGLDALDARRISLAGALGLQLFGNR